MFISGYHGTTLEAAESIISSNEFRISKKDIEWLGDGIYFYCEIDDAIKWNNAQAVIHTIISVESDNFLDLDSDEGKKIFKKVKEHLVEQYSLKISETKNKQKNQCAILRTIWNTNKNISVIAGSFREEKDILPTLTDEGRKRREFCVKNNSFVKYMHCIKKERLE